MNCSPGAICFHPLARQPGALRVVDSTAVNYFRHVPFSKLPKKWSATSKSKCIRHPIGRKEGRKGGRKNGKEKSYINEPGEHRGARHRHLSTLYAPPVETGRLLRHRRRYIPFPPLPPQAASARRFCLADTHRRHQCPRETTHALRVAPALVSRRKNLTPQGGFHSRLSFDAVAPPPREKVF